MNRTHHLSSNSCTDSLEQLPTFITNKKLITLPGSHLKAWTCLFNTQFINENEFNNEFNAILKTSSLSKRAVSKRKVEHVAGRLCFHWCYEFFSLETAPVIHSDKHGCPIWPFPFKGSISHCNDMAIATLTTASNILSLGIDVEIILEKKAAQDIASMILTQQEKNLYNNQLNKKMLFNEYVTLVFSAKEAIYKALYPQVKHFFDFSAAIVTLVTDSHIHCILRCKQIPEVIDMTGIDVSYYIDKKRVITTCIIDDTFIPYLK